MHGRQIFNLSDELHSANNCHNNTSPLELQIFSDAGKESKLNSWIELLLGFFNEHYIAPLYTFYAQNYITYLLSWALLEKPPIVQLLKNFPAFYGTRRYITVFTRALHWSLSWTRSTQSIRSHPISLIVSYILIAQNYIRYNNVVRQVYSTLVAHIKWRIISKGRVLKKLTVAQLQNNPLALRNGVHYSLPKVIYLRKNSWYTEKIHDWYIRVTYDRKLYQRILTYNFYLKMLSYGAFYVSQFSGPVFRPPPPRYNNRESVALLLSCLKRNYLIWKFTFRSLIHSRRSKWKCDLCIKSIVSILKWRISVGSGSSAPVR
jgi:hypothetical protein